ncbi:alpha/beta hydrolase domain-containing protein VTE7-like isoform X2 [Malania oleifera]|uniref:alpha/beta hydrolase domain-containing protein VTE7-like isoform X2 n=1 Tax=Malania oleifera TaxID=397392 RepID=UPI0025AE8229|nr:alpha/beta hydrolase domain-containing protein VTE7-like isoform X2 [Malania oleifera]
MMAAAGLPPPPVLRPATEGGDVHARAFKLVVVAAAAGPTVGAGVAGGGGRFPSFLPKEVENIKDPFARAMAQRIQRLPVQTGFSDNCIMSSCVKPLTQREDNPAVLLHCFDSSCLEWRRAFPLLEEAGMEAWAIDILGWGFSDLEMLPPCDVASKGYHLYQFWKSYIKRPMILVGPSLGAAAAIDFAVKHPEAVSLLKSVPLRLFASFLAFNGMPVTTLVDWTNIGRLHCLLPRWNDAMVNFMFSGGYNVAAQIKQVKQRTLVISSEHDQIVSHELTLRLHSELPNAIMRHVPDCGHLPHVEKPQTIAKIISDFARSGHC